MNGRPKMENLALRCDKRRTLWILLFVLLFMAFVLLTVPLGSIFRISGDEKFELMKAFLVSKGFALYSQIWNDQPPLHTALLAELFRLFGPSVLTARLLGLGFASIFLVSFMTNVARFEGVVTAYLAAIYLLFAYIVFRLFLSAMLEVPTFSLALLSTALLCGWKFRRRWLWLVASGLVAGVSLMVKMTGALLFPALAFEIVWSVWKQSKSAPFRQAAFALAVWTFPMFLVIGITILLFSGMSIDQLIAPHFLKIRPGITSRDLKLSIPFLWSSSSYLFLPAFVGVTLRILDGRFSTIRIPSFWFVTIFIAHLLHQPFWGFYYLHFAIPLAWLAAVGLKELFLHAKAVFQDPGSKVTHRLGWTAFLALVIISSMPAGGLYLWKDYQAIRFSPHIQDFTIVKLLSKYRDRIHWVYTDNLFLAFYAQVKVPPELAVVSLKRINSTHLTTKVIIQILKHYRPEMIVLPIYKTKTPEWKRFLQSYEFLEAQGLYAALALKDFIDSGLANAKNKTPGITQYEAPKQDKEKL